MGDSPQTLTSLSGLLAERASALAQAVDSPLACPAYLDLVRLARDLDDLAGQVLKLCVQRSRDAGHTWQELGDLLGVTRQAAFQRFGKPIDPRTGETMDKTVRMADAAERAITVVTAVLEGRMDDARQSFNAQVTAAFTDEVRGNGEPFVRRIGDQTVVDIPLRYEAGDMKARVTFDTEETVAGIFILIPEAP